MAVFDFLPFLAMVVVQIGYAGMNTTSKLAMDYSDMKPLVLVAYRQIFATLTMIPFAYFLERKTRPKLTWSVLFQIFICSLTGITGNQVLFFVGLQYSSLTTATALTEILPAVTFLLAFLCRQESLNIKRLSGQAKMIGTALCVGGAMLLTFYEGPVVPIGESSIRWKYASKSGANAEEASSTIAGPLIVIASTVSWAVWFIVQVRVSKVYPAPYTSTFFMCLMGSIECVVIGLGVNNRRSDWLLNSSIRLVSTLYAGIVCSALAFSLTSWTIQRKGALYVSVFSPLLLVVIAIIGWAILREKIYVGTVVGSVLIIAGLYSVLWGKDREAKDDIGLTRSVSSVMPTNTGSDQEIVLNIDALKEGKVEEAELELSNNSMEEDHVGAKKSETQANC